MTATELIAKVAEIVQDTSFEDDDILDLINEGIWEIAGEVDLPSLRTSAEVETTSTENSADLPDDYHKGLFWVGSANQVSRIGLNKYEYHNLHRMLEKYPLLDQVGIITDVCVDGSSLFYQGMDDDILTIRYYRQPTTLVEPPAIPVGDEYDEPTELPQHLQQSLLVSYVCKEIFAELEDGIEGQKVNTLFWEGKFLKAMARLKKFVGEEEPRETVQVRDVE